MGARASFATIIWTLAFLSACGGSDLMLPGGGGGLVVVSGDNQEGRTGRRLEKPLVVQLNDAGGQPAAGVEITFAGSAGNPAVDPDSATTDLRGQASTRVTLGDSVGAQTVQVQLARSSQVSVQFHITAVAPNGGGGG